MDVVSFILGFVKGKSSNKFNDNDLANALDYINGEEVYTIKYYDGDTLLKTEYRARGSVPTYYAGPADKADQIFVGWDHAFTTIYGDQEYHAVWEEKVSFATASWDDISRVSNSGRASRHFSIGDTKNITFKPPNSSALTMRVAIAGFDHDSLSDGTGTAGLSIVCMNVTSSTRRWSLVGSNASAYTHYYDETYIHQNELAKETGDCWKGLPAELTAVIKTVNKQIDDNTIYESPPYVETIAVDLWALSLAEMNCTLSPTLSDGSNPASTASLGKAYPLFANEWNDGTADSAPVVGGTTNSGYWLRQLALKTKNTFNPCYMSATGTPMYVDNVLAMNRIRFGFCV